MTKAAHLLQITIVAISFVLAGYGSPQNAGAASASAGQQVIDAAKKEGKVVWWTISIHDPAPIIKAFKTKHPFLEVELWDSRGPELVNKITQEQKVGRFTPDLLVLSEGDAVDLRAAGALQEYSWPNVKGWINQPSHNFWRTPVVAIMAPVYNSKLVPSNKIPKTWDDMKDPYWKGNTIASTSGSENPLYNAYIWKKGSTLNWEKSETYWQDVVKNGQPLVGRGFTAPLGMLVAGEGKLMLTSALISTLDLARKGAPVKVAPVGKVIASNWAIMLPKSSPHPNAAKLLADYLTSPEGLLIYSDQCTSAPSNSPAVLARSTVSKELKQLGLVDYEVFPVSLLTEENLKKSTDFWAKLLAAKK